MTTWDEQIPFREERDDPTDHIVDMMGAVDVELVPDAIRLLISEARLAHQRCLSDWLRQNEPETMAPPSTGPYAKWENRRRKNPGRFRDGSDLPRPPLAAVYFLCNQFYRRELGRPFHPDFDALRWGKDLTGQDFNAHEQLAMLKGAALFFVLIAQAVDFFNYTTERCKRVNDTHYRLLDRRIP